MTLFTRRERVALVLVVALILAVSVVRMLHAQGVIRAFQRGEVLRPVTPR